MKHLNDSRFRIIVACVLQIILIFVMVTYNFFYGEVDLGVLFVLGICVYITFLSYVHESNKSKLTHPWLMNSLIFVSASSILIIALQLSFARRPYPNDINAVHLLVFNVEMNSSFFMILCAIASVPVFYFVLKASEQLPRGEDKSRRISVRTRLSNVYYALVLIIIWLTFVCFLYALIHPYIERGPVPVGWDTPYYTAGSKILEKGSIQAFMEFHSYKSFLYTLFVYLLAIIGFDLLSIQIVLPAVLAVAWIASTAFLMYAWTKDRLLSSFVFAFTSTWVLLGKTVAGLHAALLAMVPLTIALAFVPKTNPFTEHYPKILPILLFVASFAHIDYTLFMISVILMYQFTFPFISHEITSKFTIRTYLNPHFSRNLFILLLSIAPALVLSTFRLGLTSEATFTSPEWIRAIYPPIYEKIDLVVDQMFTPVFVLVLVGSLLIFSDVYKKGKSSSLALFSWCFLVFLTISASVLEWTIFPDGYPIFRRLQWRVISMYPAPILAGVALHRFVSVCRRLHYSSRALGVRSIHIISTVLAMITITISIVSSSAYFINVNSNYYLGVSRFKLDNVDKIKWIESNLKFESPPIFLIDNPAYADFWENWITTFIYPNDIYVGRLQSLLSFQEEYYSDISRQHIVRFYHQRLMTKIHNISELIKHKVILIDDLYTVTPYDLLLTSEVYPGVYVGEPAALQNPTLVFSYWITAYSDVTSREGVWYTVDWEGQQSKHTLRGGFSNYTSVTYTPTVGKAGNYTLTVRYFDFSSHFAPLEIMLDGNMISTIHYNSTEEFAEHSTTIFVGEKGKIQLTFVSSDLTKPHAIALDFITLRFKN